MEWFTSDPHFGHTNTVPYTGRPFGQVQEMLDIVALQGTPGAPKMHGPEWIKRWVSTVIEMNETMIRNWNEVVKPHDTVWIVGDFSLGRNWVTEIGPRLKGHKKLIPGNHDFVHPVQHRGKPEKMKNAFKLYQDAGFEIMDLTVYREIAGQQVRITHMPPGVIPKKPNRDGTYTIKYPQYRPEPGGWIIHGHTHSKHKIQGQLIHVGVDAHDFRPIPLAWIESVIQGLESTY